MKKLLVGCLALGALTFGAKAADIPAPVYKAPAVVAPVAYNWTGFYIGGNAGYDWTRAPTR